MASSPTTSPPRNAIYLGPVYRHADRCHKLQADLTEATTYASPYRDEIYRDLQQQHLVFVRVCCEAALGILLRGKATWSNPSCTPHKKDVEEAKKLIQLAEITVQAKGLVALEAESKATATRAGSPLAKSAHLLIAAWPSILINSTACTVYFLGGSARAAMSRAAHACERIQQSVIDNPTDLIPAAIAAANGHHRIAEHVISVMSSYAAVLSHMCKLDEALRFAQLSAALSQQLHSELMVRAAYVAAGRAPANESSITGMADLHPTSLVSEPPSIYEATLNSFIQSPSLLAQRTPTALLTAITLHNCVCIMRRVREQANLPCIADDRRAMMEQCGTARQVHFLEMALDLAKAELGDVEVDAMASMTRSETPQNFISLLQLRLDELRQGQLYLNDSASLPSSPLGLTKELATHDMRMAGLQHLIKQSAADTRIGVAGPHSTFSPTPVPCHNSNPTHGTGALHQKRGGRPPSRSVESQ